MALTNIYMHIPTPSFQNYTRLNSTNFNDYVCNHSNVPFLRIQVHKKINKFKWSRDIRTQIQQSIFHASCWSRSVLYRYLCVLMIAASTALQLPSSLQIVNAPARASSFSPPPLRLPLSQSCLRAVG